MSLSARTKVSLPLALAVIGSVVGAAAFAETRALDRLEPKPRGRLSCIRCHTSKLTLDKLADKAGDPLYLVHSGDLTLAQLKALNSGKITLTQLKKQVRYVDEGYATASADAAHGMAPK